MKQGPKTVMRWTLKSLGIAFALLVLLTLVLGAGLTWPIELPFHLVTGWLFYLLRSFAEITWNWEAIASGLVYLALSVAGFHWIIRGLAASREKVWHWRWSVQISALFLIIFGVSLAIGGLVHQAVWLARADKWTTTSNNMGSIVREVNSARNMVQAIKIHASDHGGRYPLSTDALIASGFLEVWEKYAYYTSPDDELPTPWIYVRGLNDNAPGDLPLLIAPRTVSAQRRIIARNDGSVALEHPKQIYELLPKWKEGYATLGIPLPQVLAEYEEQASPASPPKK